MTIFHFEKLPSFLGIIAAVAILSPAAATDGSEQYRDRKRLAEVCLVAKTSAYWLQYEGDCTGYVTSVVDTHMMSHDALGIKRFFVCRRELRTGNSSRP